MKTNNVLHLMQTRPFVIYGNGYIARRFYNIVKKSGCAHNVSAVAVTNAPFEAIGLDGKPLRSIKDIGRNVPILLAVHNAAVEEMKQTLQELGFEQYIWVYPYLFEMEMGEPIKRNFAIATDMLIDKLPHSCNASIYYLTLKDYCQKNIYHGDLYLKFSLTYITEEMAVLRWKRFKSRIDECLKNGYSQDYSVKVNEDCYLIDGMHRLVFAKYFHAGHVYADMYAGHGEFYSQDGIGGDVMLWEKDLAKHYTADEIAAIKAADLELRSIG